MSGLDGVNATSGLPASAIVFAQRELHAVLADLQGVVSLVVATVDGFDIASAIRGEAKASRIAAMSSSICAIGDVVSREASLGSSTSVTVQTTAGFALICRVHRTDQELVVSVVADASAILAQVMYRTAKLAKLLAQA